MFENTACPRRFGDYVLVSLLGEGGMGQAYLALKATGGTEKLCVVKRLGSVWADLQPGDLPVAIARFRREAEIAMALSHGAIAQTFDAGTEEGLPFLVQEFVDGVSLRELSFSLRTAAERMPLALAAHVASEVARALAYLHDFRDLGLVHRDVTPDNVMLARAGEIKLIDFGVAKATARDEESLTGVGGLRVGKPGWCAPELLRGQEADRRSDLYSLGVLLWYLLTWRDPAEGELVAPSTVNRAVPPWLDAVVAKATARAREDRFPDAGAFQAALGRALPQGYLGEKDTAAFVARFTSRLSEQALASSLVAARALLSSAEEAPPPTPPKDDSPRGAAPGASDSVPQPVTRRVWRTGTAFRFWQSHWRNIVVLLPFAVVPALWAFWPASPPEEASRGTAPVARADAASGVAAIPRGTPVPPDAGGAGNSAEETGVRERGTVDSEGPKASPAQREERRSPGRPKQTVKSSTVAETLAAAEESLAEDHFEEAVRFGEMAAAQGAGAPAYVVIGRALAMKHDWHGARAAFEKALRLDPKNSAAARRLEALPLEQE